MTGNKRAEKRYYRHSGYPGGLKSRTLDEMLERRPEEVIRLAVQGHAAPQPPRAQADHQAQDLRRSGAPARRAEAATPGDQDLMADEKPPEDTEPEATPPADETPRPRTPAAEEPTPAEEPAPGRRAGRRGARPRRGARRRARRRGARARRGAAPPSAAAEPPPPTSDDDEEEAETPRVKPAIPGIDLEVDIVREGETRCAARLRGRRGRRGRRRLRQRRGRRRLAADRASRSTSPPARATAPPASARPPSPA